MNALLFRTRVAVLWIAGAVAVLGSILLYLFMPGALEEVLAGEVEGDPLDEAMGFFMAGLVIIPVAMAALTVLVGERLNRYVNLIAGLAFGLFGAYGVVAETSAEGFNVHILMVAVVAALAFLIAGLALAGLRQPPAGGRAGKRAESTPRGSHRLIRLQEIEQIAAVWGNKGVRGRGVRGSTPGRRTKDVSKRCNPGQRSPLSERPELGGWCAHWSHLWRSHRPPSFRRTECPSRAPRVGEPDR